MRVWLLSKVHISWHIATTCLGIVIGTSCALILPQYLAYTAWLYTGIVGLVVGIVCRVRWSIILVLAAGFLFGAQRGSAELAALQTYVPYYGQKVTLKGSLREDVSLGAKGDRRFELQTVSFANLQMPGKVWISTSDKTDIKRGDQVTVTGQLRPGFGTVPATMSRAKVIAVHRPQPGDVARQVRDWFAEGVRQVVSEPAASLGIGYLTGQRSALPHELDEQLRIAGLTHAVVASGYNLTVLVAFARRLFSPFSKFVAAITAAAMIAAFVMVTGFSPSMSRAGLVAALSLLTWYYGRVIHPFVLLAFAAGVTVLVNPSYAWGDIGWCLSFAAFIGVIILSPLIKRYFWPADKSIGLVMQTIIDTTAAQVATLPIILCTFSQLTPYALIANIIVVPLIPLAMAATFMAGLIGLAVPGWGLVGFPAQLLLDFMIAVVRWVANLPGSQTELSFSLTGLICSYLILSLLSLYMWRRTKLNFRAANED